MTFPPLPRPGRFEHQIFFRQPCPTLVSVSSSFTIFSQRHYEEDVNENNYLDDTYQSVFDSDSQPNKRPVIKSY